MFLELISNLRLSNTNHVFELLARRIQGEFHLSDFVLAQIFRRLLRLQNLHPIVDFGRALVIGRHVGERVQGGA